jgi:hypothetical protein
MYIYHIWRQKMNAVKRFLTESSPNKVKKAKDECSEEVFDGRSRNGGRAGNRGGRVFSCRQELSPGAQSGANGAVRKAAAARFNDEDYTFYFKNGREASGDCDGYSSDFGGKTTIYEWWQSDINGWEKRLLAAGVKSEVYRTSRPKHCWARFNTDLLRGTGLHEEDAAWGEAYFRMNGKETKVSRVIDLKYARAGGDFGWESKCIGKDGRQSVSEAQKNRDAPGLGLVFYANGNKKASALRGAGYSAETILDDAAFL